MNITLTLPDADFRGYYRQLGIQLPDRTNLEASVRCFADPSAHRREDRDPSCSINLINGAWNCHGCGARGGAYDAALAKGHTPRSAIDLMITHRLIERRARLQTARELLHTPNHPPASLARTRARNDPVARPALQVTDHDIARWQTSLSRRPGLLARLAQDRGWRYQTMRALELGIDRGRITIPIRNARHELRGVLRYQPEPTTSPKMLAAPGTRLGLIPHPATEHSNTNPPRRRPTRHDRRTIPRSSRHRRARRPRLATRLGGATRRTPHHNRHGRRRPGPSRSRTNRQRPRQARRHRKSSISHLTGPTDTTSRTG